MLTITLVAVVLGAFRAAPGLGVLLVIVVSPAWLRTCLNAMRRRARGRPMSALDKLGLFAGSVGVVTTVLVASSVAFYAICWAGFGIGMVGSEVVPQRSRPPYQAVAWGLYTGVALGIVAALVVGVFLLRRLWPQKGDRRKPLRHGVGRQ
jgi:hypothetical protein